MNARQRRKRMHSYRMARKRANKAFRRLSFSMAVAARSATKWVNANLLNGAHVGLDLANGDDCAVEFEFKPLLDRRQ